MHHLSDFFPFKLTIPTTLGHDLLKELIFLDIRFFTSGDQFRLDFFILEKFYENFIKLLIIEHIFTGTKKFLPIISQPFVMGWVINIFQFFVSIKTPLFYLLFFPPPFLQPLFSTFFIIPYYRNRKINNQLALK